MAKGRSKHCQSKKKPTCVHPSIFNIHRQTRWYVPIHRELLDECQRRIINTLYIPPGHRRVRLESSAAV